MGRMTNRERDVIVDEIYSKVSLPIKEENKLIIAKTSIIESSYDYLEDAKAYEKLLKRVEKLELEMESIATKYKGSVSDSGFKYHNYSTRVMKEEQRNKFIEHEKVTIANLKTPPSKDEIEKQVILAGNKDIPALIEELTLKLKG